MLDQPRDHNSHHAPAGGEEAFLTDKPRKALLGRRVSRHNIAPPVKAAGRALRRKVRRRRRLALILPAGRAFASCPIGCRPLSPRPWAPRQPTSHRSRTQPYLRQAQEPSGAASAATAGARRTGSAEGGRQRQKLPGSDRMEAAKTRGGVAGDGAALGAPRGCGCKGIRSCLLCEAAPPPQKSANFVYCPLTGFAVGEKQSEFEGWAFQFPGVILLEDFINTDEEYQMVELMDRSTWKPSQSGRRKQDYGPKVNFKKRKLKAGNFSGLPSFSKEIVARMRKYPILESFSPIEQCNLDYDPERGSAIDPHWDDWWLWGERLVSLNLLSDTVLSMSCDSEDNLQLVPLVLQETKEMHRYKSDISQKYPINDCSLPERLESTDCSSTKLVPLREILVAIYLPQRSLVVLSGPARYQWKHAIYRNHIKSRRICVTFRELTAEFGLGGEQEELGNNLLDIALTFKGSPV